jgi:L-ascorbate metabolism protein UlaG (beta-lactamase superfamily)
MRVTKFGHACLLVEQVGTEGARLLVDPGSYSPGFERLRGLAAVLITHQHPDHLDADRLTELLAHNPDAQCVADEETAEQLHAAGIAAQPVRPQDELAFAGVPVRVLGGRHATIHPDIPGIGNVGYFIADRLLHPGDALTVPDVAVDVLCLPTAAPWLKAAEAVDYLRSVRPRLALPIHEAVLARPQLYYRLFEQLAPDGTEIRVIDGGDPTEV